MGERVSQWEGEGSSRWWCWGVPRCPVLQPPNPTHYPARRGKSGSKPLPAD